jgi:hypothetical protein
LEFLMQGMMLLTVTAVTLVPHLVSIGALPGPLKFLGEMLTGFAALYVLIAGTRQRFHLVNAKYWIAFGALAIVLICGAAANAEGPGPIVSGMRYYLRAIPFFFIPAVYDFKEWQLRQQLRVLSAICLLQVPVAAYERHNIMITGHTSNADAVFGTLGQSGVLSLFLVCALCLYGAALLRGQLTIWTFGALFLLLVIPMSINETKVTAIILPLGLLITFILGAPPHRKLRAAVGAAAILGVGAAIFIPVFDYYQSKSVVPYKIADFFTNKNELSSYLETGARVGSDREAGRVDAITVPLHELLRDPVTFAFGFGLGNASRSSLGANFIGDYYGLYGRFTRETSVSAFLLETGALGIALILFIHWLVFTDALHVARSDNTLVGTVALGSVGAIVVITICLFYIAIHIVESLSYLFWFLAGLIAARRERIRIS